MLKKPKQNEQTAFPDFKNQPEQIQDALVKQRSKKAEGWGAKVIDRLSVDLNREFPDQKAEATSVFNKRGTFHWGAISYEL
jgi:hypothetical protein